MDGTQIRLPEGLDADTAADVLREYARTDDAQIVDHDTLSKLREEITEAKEAFAAVIAEQSPQSADTLARQDMDALTEPFRDDEGAIDVDTLQQTPETQSGGTGTGTGSGHGDGDGDGGSGFNADSLSLSDEKRLKRLGKKRKSFEKRGIDSRVDALEAEMCDIAGTDDYDVLEREVL